MAITLGLDTFGRTVANGSWGSANTGGPWTLIYGPSGFLVDPGAAKMVLQPTYAREVNLGAISKTNVVIRASFASSSAYSGGAQNINIIGRKISTFYYIARVRIESGLLRLYIMRMNSAGGEAALVSSTTISHTYVPGEAIWCELSISGVSPTTIAAKMWLATDTEPGTYQQSTTDTTAGYQVAGTVGLGASIGASASSATISFSYFSAVDPTMEILDAPVVTLNSINPTTIGGNNGSVTATWPVVPGAYHYETCLVSGTQTTGFVADDGDATSPKTYTGLMAGSYTVAVRAKAS